MAMSFFSSFLGLRVYGLFEDLTPQFITLLPGIDGITEFETGLLI